MSKAKKQKKGNKHRALSAQQTIPYIAMHPDGICQLPGGLYTKTLEYEDINYAVASTEDQTAIISGWSACLNYFDSSLPFQLSFVNRRSRNANRYKVNIPAQEDDFNSIRGEYVEMLKGQIAKSNNGIERYKYITFGLPAEGVAEARPRLGRVEADVMGNLKRLGVQSRPLDGRDRLAVLHGQMHPGGREPFRFAWKDIPKTGMGTKDYIAPDSFDFRQSRTFRVGQMWGAASYLQIMASELSDKLLAEILELDKPTVLKLAQSLQERLEQKDSGVCLLRIDNQFQMASKPEYGDIIRKVMDMRRNVPLSPAAMEVLSIVAYNQPVTKAFIEQIRGVDCSGVLQSLTVKELVEEKGRLELPGRPLLYGTTDNFLRCFQLSSLEELPPLPEKEKAQEPSEEGEQEEELKL